MEEKDQENVFDPITIPEIEGDPWNGYWYVCGECHGYLKWHEDPCPHCGWRLNWHGQDLH